jgi:hypothetical protein
MQACSTLPLKPIKEIINMPLRGPPSYILLQCTPFEWQPHKEGIYVNVGVGIHIIE